MENQRVGPFTIAGDLAACGHVESHGAAETVADQFPNTGGDGAKTRGERSLGKPPDLPSADGLPDLGGRRRRHCRMWTKQLYGDYFPTAPLLAMQSQLQFEKANLQHSHFVQAAFDCSKAYEFVEHPRAHLACRQASCPAQVADMLFNMYSCPRRLRLETRVTAAVTPSQGIAAGCGLAIDVLKSYFAGGPLTMMFEANSKVQMSIRDYVDDIILMIGGTDLHEVAAQAHDTIPKVAAWLKGKNMKVNEGKTQISASNRKLLRAVREGLDLPEQVYKNTQKDLGVRVGQQNFRNEVWEERVASTAPMAGRIGQLPSPWTQKSRMIQALLYGRMCYGVEVAGMTVRLMQTLQRLAVTGLGRASKVCTGAALLLVSGPSLHPRVQCIQRTCRLWRMLGNQQPDTTMELIQQTKHADVAQARNPGTRLWQQ